jgi:hypothetical protein
MDWVNPGVALIEPLAPQIEAMRSRARSYWRAEVPQSALYPEALVAGRVVISSVQSGRIRGSDL